MQNPKKSPSNDKLSDIANIMDDILTNMKSHIERIQKKDGDKNTPGAFKDAGNNSYDQSRTLQNIINFTLKDPKYLKNGEKNDVLLTDAEKREILANAFIKVNPYLKPPETNNIQSIRPDLSTLDELIKQTDKDIALSHKLTRKTPSNHMLDKQTAKTINEIKNAQSQRPDTSQSNRLTKKTNIKNLKHQKTTSKTDNPRNNFKPIIVTTHVQKPPSPTAGIKPRSSSIQKRNPSEKFDLKQPTQSIPLKATTNRLSVRSSPPPSARGSTRKQLNSTSTNLRSRSLSIDHNRTHPQNFLANRSFNESSRNTYTSVPPTRGRPSTVVPSARERPATACPLVRPSTALNSKDRPSTAMSNARPSIGGRPSTAVSPTRDRSASPIPVARPPSGFPPYRGRPMSMDSRIRPPKTFPQKNSNNSTASTNKIAARPRSMDSKAIPRSETFKVFPKKTSENSNNYSMSNASRNTMKKAFSGVKNDEFVKNLTKQISREIRKNSPMLMEKRAFYVQGTIPNHIVVNRAFTTVDKSIDQLIKPISANVINQIITKNNAAQTKVINQPVNSDIFPSESEVKKETNTNEIHKLIPTNVKLIENMEKINYHVNNKPTEKDLETSEQSVTKKSVSFQKGENALPPESDPVVITQVESRPQTPTSRPRTPASSQVLEERQKIQSFPMLDITKAEAEIAKLFDEKETEQEDKTCTETTVMSPAESEENKEIIEEINKQIEEMMTQILDPITDNNKASTVSNLSEGVSKMNNLELLKSKQQKEEPPKPQSQAIVPFASKQSVQISKTATFLKPELIKPFKPGSQTSFNDKLPVIPLAPMSKKFLPTPMELVHDFINMVTQAKKAKKTYTVCGNFFAIRRAFAERGWIEKMRINIMDDKESWRKIESLSNYELVEGIRNKEYGEKYRRVFLTKLLTGHQVDFYWDYLTNPFTANNDRVKRTLINRFPYGATRSYTTKHGLSESLKESHWFSIEGYANILFPRTYNLSVEQEMKSFIDDFRITGAISLLQWILNTTSEKVMSAEGTIPISVFNFATMQCHHFLKEREHRDIDELIPMTKECEWDVFLDKYYKLIHFEHMFQKSDKISIDAMVDQSRYIINKVKKYLPDVNVDGHRNMWLLKPNNGSRGYGILVCRTLKYMLETIHSKKDIKYIAQKYIERPLLIRKTKFDIRQWFLITCMPNVKIWIYKENYLRFSSQVFDLSKLHESIHLTNNSIQCRYKNHNNRSNILPEQNMWHSDTFRRYLADSGHPYTWRNVIYKGMKECLIALFMLCQDKLETRVNSFELCGADFMLDEDFRPYLIEINSRPALYPSTKITGKLCPKVLEDVIKVVIDNARNPKASTGDFELIYTDTFNYSIPRHENSLHMKGINYFQKYAKVQPFKAEGASCIKICPSVKITSQIQTQEEKNVNSESLQKFLNLDASRVRKDVKTTLEKILGVINSCEENGETNKEKALKRSKQLRTMLSEFVNIISSSAGRNKLSEDSQINIV